MQKKIIWFALIALLICNIVFAYLLWGKKSRHKGNWSPVNSFVKKLDLGKAKEDSVLAIMQQSFEASKPFRDSLQAKREAYMNALLNSNDSLTLQSLQQQSNTLRLQMDRQMLQAIQKCKSICNEAEAKKIDSMWKETMLMRGKRNHKK